MSILPISVNHREISTFYTVGFRGGPPPQSLSILLLLPQKGEKVRPFNHLKLDSLNRQARAN
jgi:hypothetical protein